MAQQLPCYLFLAFFLLIKIAVGSAGKRDFCLFLQKKRKKKKKKPQLV